MTEGDAEAMAEQLRAAGYLVTKIPACTRSSGHGRHVLIIRTASCEGVEPIPHGPHSVHQGMFGLWYRCKCGHEFPDYTESDDGPTQWQAHKAETESTP